MEHSSELVADGRLTGEYSYPQRAERYTELVLDGIKIDYYDAKNRVVREVKRSAKMEQAHIAQVQYYLWVLERNGIMGARGTIEYPKQRHTEQVELTDEVRAAIPLWVADIERITQWPTAPKPVRKSICKSCSYHDFCFVE